MLNHKIIHKIKVCRIITTIILIGWEENKSKVLGIVEIKIKNLISKKSSKSSLTKNKSFGNFR